MAWHTRAPHGMLTQSRTCTTRTLRMHARIVRNTSCLMRIVAALRCKGSRDLIRDGLRLLSSLLKIPALVEAHVLHLLELAVAVAALVVANVAALEQLHLSRCRQTASSCFLTLLRHSQPAPQPPRPPPILEPTPTKLDHLAACSDDDEA